MTATEGLVAADVVVRFGGLVALDGVSVAAPPGRITGLIGPNGAGKTTLFNVCCGFLSPESGTVLLDAVDVTRLSAAQRARQGLGRTFQRMELFGSLTVRENIEFAAETTQVSRDPLTQLGLRGSGRTVQQAGRTLADELLELTGLTSVAHRAAAEISTGQGRLLELARAMARTPRILLLDEPSSGLDPGESKAFGTVLTQLVATRGLGILMIEHDMSLILNVCQHVYVLDFGKPLMNGTPAEVRRSELVRDAYLGSPAVRV